jgi:hypothetical protein
MSGIDATEFARCAARVAALHDRISKAADGFTPPAAVRAAAARGLDLRARWGRGGLSTAEASAQGIGSGVQRATNLKNGDAISRATLRMMRAFFARHQKNYAPDKRESDGGPTAGTIAWLLWGGSAGRSWANSTLERIEKTDAADVHVPTADWTPRIARRRRRKIYTEED